MTPLSPARAAVALAGLVLACHAVLPFTDYVSYDDMYMVNWVTRGDLGSLWTLYESIGGQIGYAYFASFAETGDLVLPFKVAGVVVAFVTGMLVWRVGVESGLVSAAEALVVAAVAVALPAFKMKGGFVYSVYEWTPALFLLATLLALRAERRTGWPHAGRRAAALLLFAVAFTMPSLLVVYGGFFLLLILAHDRRVGRRWYRLPFGFVARRADYLALPFGYWVVKNEAFPPQGVYATYNQVSPTWEAAEEAADAVPDVIADPVLVVADLPVEFQVGVVVAGLAAWWATGVWRWRADRSASTCGPVGLLLFGGLLLVMAVFPYAAVGKIPGPWGVRSTYATLIPIPFAVLVLGALKAVGRIVPRATPVATAGLAVFAACCAAGWWHNALSMQAVEARNRALVRQIRSDPAADGWTVYGIVNRYPIPRTMDALHGWEWVWVEAGADRPPRSFAYNGIPDHDVPEWYVRQCLGETTIGYSLTAIDTAGRQGVVILRPGTADPPACVGWRYVWAKHVRPGQLDGFLDQLVTTDFYPSPWQPAEIARQAGPPP